MPITGKPRGRRAVVQPHQWEGDECKLCAMRKGWAGAKAGCTMVHVLRRKGHIKENKLRCDTKT